MNRLNMVKHQNKEDNITIMKKMMLQEKKQKCKQTHRDNLGYLQRGNHQSGIRFSLSKN